MTAINRPVLGSLSTNALVRNNNDLLDKPTLPRLKSVIPQVSISKNNIRKPQSPKEALSNAEKLKYRLQLAYYKLRTDQATVPINDIMKKHNDTTNSITNVVTDSTLVNNSISITDALESHLSTYSKPNLTPSASRHIRLLAASTPLHESSHKQNNNLSKKVTFNKSNSYLEPGVFARPNSLKDSVFKRTESESLLKTYSSPNLAIFHHPSNPPQDISIQGNTTIETEHSTIIDNDLTISNIEITPVKGRTIDDNGDLLMSSPTKKIFSSTPGSYGAAKSLLQLSLISSN